MPEHNTSRTISTADTLFEIMETLRDLDGSTVTEVAKELDLAKSTVHAYLASLEQKEYVVKEDNRYELGLKFYDHGMDILNRMDLVEVARPIMRQTAEESGELVWLFVEEHGRGIYLERAKGDRAVQTSGRRGLRTYLHLLAAGKAMLAEMPEKRVEEIIDRHGLPQQTAESITDKQKLYNRLEVVCDRGYAYNRGEEVPGVYAIGAPIMKEGDVQAGISVAGPAARFNDDSYDTRMRNTIIEAANTIELNLKYQ
jgi:DNA-binding IclR family transcriptional regulator